MICKCKNPQPNIFIANGNFCDKCKNRIIFKEMKSKSLNPDPIQIRIGILKHYCRNIGHAELLREKTGETLSEYLNKPFNYKLYLRLKGSFGNNKKMNINPFRI